MTIFLLEILYHQRRLSDSAVGLKSFRLPLRGEETTEVDLQRKYAGHKPVLTSEEAAQKVTHIDGLLIRLNEILGSNLTRDKLLETRLQECVDQDFDLGMAYAYLRPLWYFHPLISRIATKFYEKEDQEMRQNSVHNHHITHPHIPPRRIWDLYANRVIPSWWHFERGTKPPIAISHCWVGTEQRQHLNTPINGCSWPVPLPADTSLERVRIELLNLGLEYVWLDVLCLWQKGIPSQDAQRLEQWTLDIPTIGHIYQVSPKVVHYYSGLGRPFVIGDLSYHRHWLNRAWTLQEVHDRSVVGGMTKRSPVKPLRYPKPGKEPDVDMFYDKIDAVATACKGKKIIPLIEIMSTRFGEEELDRIGGLTYLLEPKRIPTYMEISSEEVWLRLVASIDSQARADLLFLWPEAGDGTYSWCPSWRQLMNLRAPKALSPKDPDRAAVDVDHDGRGVCHCILLEDCTLSGLLHSPKHSKERLGEVSLWYKGRKIRFEVVSTPGFRIADGTYSLAGGPTTWVIGKRMHDGAIKKVSVVEVYAGEDTPPEYGFVQTLFAPHPQRRTVFI